MRDHAHLPDTSAGDHAPLGAVFDGSGVNFAVFSENATKIELRLFSADEREEIARISLPERTGPVWRGFVAGLKPGALYGYRAYGPLETDRGHRFNPQKLLAARYARVFHRKWRAVDEVLGHEPSAPDRPCPIDSAPFFPRSIAPEIETPWTGAPAPRRAWSDTVIYEAHVKGLTRLHPDIPEALRGAYEALGEAPLIDHLKSLGVNTLEILPVQAFLDDGFLVERGPTNYWG